MSKNCTFLLASWWLFGPFVFPAGCSQPDNAPRVTILDRTSADPSPVPNSTGGSASTSSGGGTAIDTGGAEPNSNAPITGLSNRTWNWVPFEDAHCRSGSSTGIGINPNPASDKLLILLEGGGACFDAATCGLTISIYGSDLFSKFAVDDQHGGGAGVFNRNDPANPVRDWNFVYVPYCTGDVHAGNNPQGVIDTLKPQQFVGYVNMGLYLKRIVPTFPGMTQVLLTGVSAGGFGALANYVQVAKKFDPVPISLLDDSGPPMDDPVLPACLAQTFARTWNLDQTVQRDCGSDCTDTSHLLIDFLKHVSKIYPDVPFGLIESTGDWVISIFFGFGQNDCSGFSQLAEATFTAGVQDIRAQMAGQSNFGAFLFPGLEHTTLLDSTTFDTRVAADVKLTDYIAALLNGQVTSVGP